MDPLRNLVGSDFSRLSTKSRTGSVASWASINIPNSHRWHNGTLIRNICPLYNETHYSPSHPCGTQLAILATMMVNPSPSRSRQWSQRSNDCVIRLFPAKGPNGPWKQESLHFGTARPNWRCLGVCRQLCLLPNPYLRRHRLRRYLDNQHHCTVACSSTDPQPRTGRRRTHPSCPCVRGAARTRNASRPWFCPSAMPGQSSVLAAGRGVVRFQRCLGR